MSAENDVTRRQMLVVTAGAIAATPLLSESSVGALVQTVAGGPKFLTKEEFAMLDELSEMIIPTDEHSPGARAAKCAAYIDGRLAEAFEDDRRLRFREGLKSVDALSHQLNGHPFMEASEAERLAVLTKLAENEAAPKTAEDKFFNDLKGETIHAYYTSDIGIHKEMEYKGNTLLQEFAGTDVSGHPALESSKESKG
jgi:hypothetical protein